MGDKSDISWCDATWNPTVGCTRVSSGCDHCYAFALHDKRHVAWKRGHWPDAPAQYHQPFSHVQVLRERLELPLHWRKPRRIFVNSLSDLFHEDVPDAVIADVWSVMEMAPQHIYQVLTKRPDRMGAWVRDHKRWFDYAAGPGVFDASFRHVWLGTSCEHQAAADERIPWLITTPAAVRFVSLEPLLGPIDLARWLTCCPSCGSPRPDRYADACGYCEHGGFTPALSWVVVGGESGPQHRALSVRWLTDLVDQCRAAGVPTWVKQESGYRPGQQGRIPDSHWLQQFPEAAPP